MNADKLRELHGKGWSDRRIAEALGVSNAAVNKQRKALGLAANNPVKRRMIDMDVLIELARTGKSDEEIAAHFGVQVHSIRKARTRGNVTAILLKDKNAADERVLREREREREEENRVALWKQGLTDKQLAEQFGMTVSGVSEWRARRGLASNRVATPAAPKPVAPRPRRTADQISMRARRIGIIQKVWMKVTTERR